MASNYSNSTNTTSAIIKTGDQGEHATEWMLFEENIGPHLSLDETALSRDELYTVIINKAARG